MNSPTDAGSDKPGVLAALDSAAATSFYWYLALLACIGGFLFGYDTAVIGSVLDFIPYQLSDLAKGYLAGGASLGAAVGALAAGPLTDRFGRKSLLIADAIVYALGAILSAVAVNAFMLLSSRTLIGLAVGADSALATAYIVEFAPSRRRGSLAILQQWMITVGILVSYLVALLTLKIAPEAAGGADWRIILGLGAVPALVAIALRSRMPESPRWLLHKGRLADARQALDQLGVQASEDQVHDTAERIAAADRDQQHVSPWTRGVRRALVVVCVFFVFQQITGINVPFYYGPQLLGQLFQGGSNPVDAAVAGIAAAAVLGAVNVVATFFAFRYIDRIGRRKLAIGGYAGMAIFILITAAGVAFLMGPAQITVVIVGFSFFITSFAIGVGGTGWLIQGEVFPTAIRGRAASIGAAVDWVANFAIILLFPALTTAFGLPVLMVLLAVLAVLAIGFVARYLPETKNLTLDEVTHTFDQQAGTTHHATT